MFRTLAIALTLATAAHAAPQKLVVGAHSLEVVPGKTSRVITMNGSVPGPVIRLKQGETAEIQVENRLKGKTSIHWHGLLLDGAQDGSPGFNGFGGIPGNSNFTYRFPVRQSGTYWYHAHSLDEQAGQYAALIIDPAGEDPIKSDREHVLLISDHHETSPERIFNNLKADSDFYNWNKRTLPQMLRDADKFGLGKTIDDRVSWGNMRMDPTDISDVSGYTLLLNGLPTARTPWLEAHKGERVRLRIVNGSAMSFIDVRAPGADMEIVAADGRRVEPVRVDEFRMGVAETYDVIVTLVEDGAVPLFIETMDRKASVLASLGPRPGMAVAAPAGRPRQILLAGEMGHGISDAMGQGMAPNADDPDCPPEHAAMGHCTPAKPAAPAGDPNCPPEHAAMGHCTPATPPPTSPGPRVGTAVVEGGITPYPRVDYGYGSNPMAGMNHGEITQEGDVDAMGRVTGWATGAPRGARVLSMRDLVRAEAPDDTREPTREIDLRLTGNMARYIWSLNGKRYGEAEPIVLNYGERVRITFHNETMMAHPMHLHGLFFEVENGQPMDKLPSKNVIVVAPGRTQSILVTANEPGEWPLHCHLLYHMASGMIQKLVIASADGSVPVPTTHVH
jgi:CopA family copper-resistance protein